MRSVCGHGFYQSTPGTPQTNRECTPCEAGVTYQNQLDQTECVPVTPCKAGTVSFRSPTSTNDRICVGCDGASSYQDEAGADVCKPVTQCEHDAGLYVATPATATSDAQCAALHGCSDGEFQDGFVDASSGAGRGDRKCTAHRVCVWPDEYEYRAPTLTSDRVCSQTTECRANHFEVVVGLGNEAEKDVVDGISGSGDGSGLDLFTATRDRVCEKCTSCSRFGEYAKKACGRTTDAECAACSMCNAGDTYQVTPCSTSADTVCTPCTPCGGSMVATSFGQIYVGMFAASVCTVDQDTVCQTCTQCKETEHEASQCTSAADTVCTLKCGYAPPQARAGGDGDDVSDALVWNGQSFTDSDGVCRSPTVCGAGEWEVAAPTPDGDRVCQPWTACIGEHAGDDGETRPALIADKSGSAMGATLQASYEVVVPSETSDRRCKAATECTSDEFQTLAPTLLSDRVCNALTACAADAEYVAVGATPTTDRVCRDHPGCTVDERVTETLESDGETLVLTCTRFANVTAMQARRTAAVAKSSGLVVGFAAFLLLIAFLVVRSNTEGTFVVGARKAADEWDYFDFDPSSKKKFWFRFEKRVEMIPGKSIRPISALKAAAARLIAEKELERLHGAWDSDSDGDGETSDDADGGGGYLTVVGDAAEGAGEDPSLGSPGAPLPTMLPGTDTTPGMITARLDSVQSQLTQLALLQQQDEMHRRQALADEANARAQRMYLAAQEETRRRKAEVEEAARVAAQEAADRQKEKAAAAEEERAAAEKEEAARLAAEAAEADRKRKEAAQEEEDRKKQAAAKKKAPTMKAVPEWKRLAAEKAAARQQEADAADARKKATAAAFLEQKKAESAAARQKAAADEEARRLKAEADALKHASMQLTKKDKEMLFNLFTQLNKDGDTFLSAQELTAGLHETKLQEILTHYNIDGPTLISRLDKENRGEIGVSTFIHGVVRVVREHADAAIAASGGLGTFLSKGLLPGESPDNAAAAKKLAKPRTVTITAHAIARSRTRTLGFKMEMRKPAKSLSGDPAVKQVDVGGAAYGKLTAGDNIISINGTHVVGKSAEAIGEILAVCTGDFTFTVTKG